MDQIREAFQKVKQDMDLMKDEISLLNKFLTENQKMLSDLNQKITNLSHEIKENPLKEQNFIPANKSENTTISTNIPTHNYPFEPLKPQNSVFSSGNQGVPTNRQTNQQTNQQMEKESLNNALEVLNSLDNLKKEIRNKFKRITEQEFLVFSTIYQMEEEGTVDYKAISQRLNLTESSIRDYVGKLIKKGIPVEKTKINNKMIHLSVSQNLKKVAPLSVILQLREL